MGIKATTRPLYVMDYSSINGGGVSSWTSPSLTTLLPPLLSIILFLSAGSVYVGATGIGVRGLGITGTLGIVALAWDSSRESKSDSLFSITIPSNTLMSSWFSLTRAVVSWGAESFLLGRMCVVEDFKILVSNKIFNIFLQSDVL